ncbi:MAG: EAL domain-containing protein [Sandaracinaceae bacterium]|nr:EAL domain-containing protein [Myxococcales bacterium]MCB9662166.1 EAL domain-containing protein [Sandaracinaceae bacterium]
MTHEAHDMEDGEASGTKQVAQAGLPAAIVVVDEGGALLFSGGTEPVWAGAAPAGWLDGLPAGEADRVRASVATALRDGAMSARLLLPRGHGLPVRTNVRITALDAPDGVQVACLMALHDVSSDAGRDRFLDSVQDLLAEAQSAFAVGVVDLPEFRRVVSGLGTADADALLRGVLARITTTLGARASVQRIGPSEFALLIPQGDDEELVQAWMEDLHDELRSPYRVKGRDVTLRNAVGFASAKRGYLEAATLLSDAETAALHANIRDTSGSAVFRTAIRDEDRRVIEVASALRSAVQRGEMHLVYQPILALDTQRVAGFEALVRWTSPSLGVVGPDEFIPIAEKLGWVGELDTWVMRNACSWAAGVAGAFSLSVNVSARWSDDMTLIDRVAETLRETLFPVERLRVEITETALARDAVASRRVLRGLHDLGVSLAMDDFGTGYSSLRALAELPLDVLKIDRTFIDPIDRDARACDIVSAVVAMGQSLGMSIVAEGVETEGQRERLTSMGCDLGQGYLFERPLSGADAQRRLLADR